MGDRIHFRERQSNAADFGGSFSQISKIDQRIKFERGWLTGGTNPGDGSQEVGDGTLYPIEVTVPELAEIYSRVRDSTVSWGGLSADYSYSSMSVDYTGTVGVVFKGGLPPTNMARDVSGISYNKVSPFGAATATTSTARASQCIRSSASFGGTDHPTDRGGALGGLYFIDTSGTGLQARDPLTEHAMWIQGYRASSNPPVGTFSFPIGGAISTAGDYIPSGMCQYSRSSYNNAATDVGAGFYGMGVNGVRTITPSAGITNEAYYQESFFAMKISEVVAFIDVTGSGDPLDAGNRLFLNALCFVESRFDPLRSGGIGSRFTVTTRKLTNPITTAVVKLVLSDGVEVSAPLYFDDESAVSLNLLSLSDIVITATEWWPYADQAGLDAWNTATGAAANGGPA